MRNKELKKFLKNKYFVLYITPEGEEKAELCYLNRAREICKDYNLDREDIFIFSPNSEIPIEKILPDKLVNGEFISVWDGGTVITSKCKVNPLTKEIVEIETVDVQGLDCLDEEYVYIQDKKYPVYKNDEYKGIGLYYK